MLPQVDVALEAFLRATTPLSAVDIDVSFEAPDEEWSAKLSRPTVNAHLWDIRRSTSHAVTGVEESHRNGVTVRRMALPRLELRYFVSVWTSEHEDERALTGALLVALLAHGEIPTVYLPQPLQGVPNPQLALARAGDTETFQIDGRMKLGLQLQVVTVVDTGAGTPLARPVSDLGITVLDRTTGATDAGVRRIAGECLDPAAIGATVRAPRGIAVVNEAGRFLIAARAGDELVLEVPGEPTVTVAPVGGVVFPADAPQPVDHT
jgi:hypothetical protein